MVPWISRWISRACWHHACRRSAVGWGRSTPWPGLTSPGLRPAWLPVGTRTELLAVSGLQPSGAPPSFPAHAHRPSVPPRAVGPSHSAPTLAAAPRRRGPLRPLPSPGHRAQLAAPGGGGSFARSAASGQSGAARAARCPRRRRPARRTSADQGGPHRTRRDPLAPVLSAAPAVRRPARAGHSPPRSRYSVAVCGTAAQVRTSVLHCTMSAVSSFVLSVECDHVSIACLFCTDERPLAAFGRDGLRCRPGCGAAGVG
jgi:hypothetical protein